MPNKQKTSGIIFDMDGTLVDSQLDFQAMRAEMDLPEGQPILESLEKLDQARRATCNEILARHEAQGAACATLIDGVAEMLGIVQSLSIKMAIVTRNSRLTTDKTLARLNIAQHFDPILTRECGPQKPDPWSILHICQQWKVTPAEVVMVGDFHFDLITGNNAGCPSVLYTAGRSKSEIEGHHLAAIHVDSFLEIDRWLAWLASSIV
ncbi:MAG: HAD family hydrolase [Pirellulales bacterium]|jgi:HAD superfamily hydrolase (TIGR01549 family)